METNIALQALYHEVTKRRQSLHFRDVAGFAISLKEINRCERSDDKEFYSPLLHAMTGAHYHQPVERLRSWCKSHKIRFFEDKHRDAVNLTFTAPENYYFHTGRWEGEHVTDWMRRVCHESQMVGALKARPNIVLLSDEAKAALYEDPEWQRWAMYYMRSDECTFEDKQILRFEAEGCAMAAFYLPPTSPFSSSLHLAAVASA